jgi:hypothetical protein
MRRLEVYLNETYRQQLNHDQMYEMLVGLETFGTFLPTLCYQLVVVLRQNAYNTPYHISQKYDQMRPLERSIVCFLLKQDFDIRFLGVRQPYTPDMLDIILSSEKNRTYRYLYVLVSKYGRCEQFERIPYNKRNINKKIRSNGRICSSIQYAMKKCSYEKVKWLLHNGSKFPLFDDVTNLISSNTNTKHILQLLRNRGFTFPYQMKLCKWIISYLKGGKGGKGGKRINAEALEYLSFRLPTIFKAASDMQAHEYNYKIFGLLISCRDRYKNTETYPSWFNNMVDVLRVPEQMEALSNLNFFPTDVLKVVEQFLKTFEKEDQDYKKYLEMKQDQDYVSIQLRMSSPYFDFVDRRHDDADDMNSEWNIMKCERDMEDMENLICILNGPGYLAADMLHLLFTNTMGAFIRYDILRLEMAISFIIHFTETYRDFVCGPRTYDRICRTDFFIKFFLPNIPLLERFKKSILFGFEYSTPD